MNTFFDYDGFPQMQGDPALEAELNKCKTSEERERVVNQYIAAKVKVALISLAVLIVLMLFAALIAILHK